MKKKALIISISFLILISQIFLLSSSYIQNERSDQNDGEAFEIMHNSVQAYINDTTPPLVSTPPDIYYPLEQTGNVIVWNGSDENPASYEIFRDDILIKSGPWNSSQETFNVSVDGLTVTSEALYQSLYHYRIVLMDQANNSVSDFVVIVVYRTTTTTAAHSEPAPYTPWSDPQWLFQWALIFSCIGLAILIIILVKEKM